MATTIIEKCPFCKKTKSLLRSNNPIVAPICEDCLNDQLDYNSLKSANFFCRTYNLPFYPDRWIAMAAEAGKHTFSTYASVISDEHPNTLYKGDSTDLLWERADEEWQKIKTHDQLLSAIKPIKEEWITMMQIKWGTRFSFGQLMELENLYTSTVRAAGISNPLTMAIVKKIAIANVDMNEALDNLDIKAAESYNKIIAQLIKSAGLEDIVDTSNTEVISSVSELCQYLEDNGFQFHFYDNVPRDIVDATIEDQKEWTRRFVLDATGIQQTYELIEDSYKNALEEGKTKETIDQVSLDQLVQERTQGINKEFDAQIEGDNFDLGDFDE